MEVYRKTFHVAINMPNEFINLFESGLSRVWQASEKFDVAMLTAWRNRMMNCIKKDQCTGEVLTRNQKNERNTHLKAALLQRGYGVTHIDGSYIEEYSTSNEKECAEQSFFVVNLNNDFSFTHVIAKLGAEYCQSSVFLKPVGEAPYLIGTNNEEWPGLWKKISLPNLKVGWSREPAKVNGKDVPGIPRASHMGYSKVGGRPFGWTESLETKSGLQNNAKSVVALWGMKVLESAGVKDAPFTKQ